MSKRLQDHAPYLHVLVNGTAKQLEGILRGANKKLIYCLCECALNVLQGNVKLHNSEKDKLRKHKQPLRVLADKRVALGRKRELLLNQKGGWVTALIVPILSSLTGLLFKR